MKFEAKDVSFFPVSPAMFFRDDKSWEAYRKNQIKLEMYVSLCRFGLILGHTLVYDFQTYTRLERRS